MPAPRRTGLLRSSSTLLYLILPTTYDARLLLHSRSCCPGTPGKCLAWYNCSAKATTLMYEAALHLLWGYRVPVLVRRCVGCTKCAIHNLIDMHPQDAIDLLEPMTKHPVDFVCQGAFISLSMILVQQSDAARHLRPRVPAR